jgi:hypothetical protein
MEKKINFDMEILWEEKPHKKLLKLGKTGESPSRDKQKII